MIISRQDLINHYGERELARASDGGDTIDEVSLSSWIELADAKVQTYLNPSGIDDISALPRSSQVALKNAARVIVWYWMWKDGYTDDMEKDYKAEIRWLESVQKNSAMLTGNKPSSHKLSSIKLVRS